MNKFHGNCNTKSTILAHRGNNTTTKDIAGGYCQDHKVDICRCGWEFGWHFGTASSDLQEILGRPAWMELISSDFI